MNNLLKNATVLTKAQQKKISGGVSQKEYCEQLRNMLMGDGYQGDIGWGMQVFY